MTIRLKQNDTVPNLEQTLTDPDGMSADLRFYNDVRFIMRDKYTLETIIDSGVSENVNVIDDENGVVEYDWSGEDTARAGEYEAEWQVNYGSDSSEIEISTYPNDGYIDITIVSDI